MNKEEISKKLIAIFFLLLFTNSIFAYNIDPNRLSEKENVCANFSGSENVTDFGAGCFTEKLPADAVEKIWDEILIDGFTVDTISSNQPANTQRDKMDKNQVMLSNPDSKSGDMTLKREMPSEIMEPLETPSILGQTCYGPFSYGINLEQTLRVGRCTGDENTPCYLEQDGLFRQNGAYGFWEETNTIGKDIIDMIGINKLKEEAGEIIDSKKDYSTNVDLGMFSEMSYEELSDFKKAQFEDINNPEIQIKTTSIIQDKAIQNSVITDTFNSSMETTCNSDNCYISVYSLFDKMFNQYFSADLVFSSASPVLWHFTSRIFQGIGKGVKKHLATDLVGKSKLTKNKGGFFDNLLNEGLSPHKAIERALKVNRIKKNVDNYIDVLAKENEKLYKSLDRYNLKPQFEKYTDAIKSKKNIRQITDEFFQSGEFTKLNKAQKRVFFDSVRTSQEHLKVIKTLQKNYSDDISKILNNTDNVYKISPKQILNDPTKNMDDFYKSITKEDYLALKDKTRQINKLTKSYDEFTKGSFKWDDGAADLKRVTERKFTMTNPAGEPEEFLVNKVKRKGSGDATTIPNTAKGSDGFIPKDKELGTELDKFMETKNVTVTFKDGSTDTITKMVPYKETINTNGKDFFVHQLSEFRQRPDVYIEYMSESTGALKKVRATSLNVDDVSQANPSLKWYPIELEPMTNADDVLKYGYDPVELAYSMVDEKTIKRINDATAVTDDITRVMTNQGWSTGRGINYINQQMKQQSSGKYLTKSLDIIGGSAKMYWYNWAYWEVKTAGQSLPFIPNSLEKYSAYRIPDTYTSIKINHENNADVYDDAYIDYFSNDGSDQGDLFMQYFNSLLFWMVNLSKEVLEETEWSATQGINDWVKKITEGHIRRNQVDDIALFTDAENGGCKTNCYIKIGDSKTLEKLTLEKSVGGDINSPDLPSLDIDKLTISYGTPDGVTVPNYILENTSKKNMEEEGQNLIAFSHHTDYSGVMGGQSTENNPVSLTSARTNNETCSQKLKELEILGVPIGWTNSWTGKAYRAGMVSAAFSNLSYIIFSAPHHRMILGMVIGDAIPQALIMPQIHNCVDDEEGYYSHIFVAKEEYERIDKDPKNKIGNAIEDGAKGIEKTLLGVTKGTQLEQSVNKTTEEIENFAQNNLIDNPIIQSRYETIGSSSASVKGKLFFLELGENTSCRVSGYNDKGVEYLTDNSKEKDLIIDKDKGELSIVDKDGTVKNIIDPKNKDWVRLIATNLGIPAKVIPNKLSYIPLSDNNKPMFSMDVYGNLTIEDTTILNCIKNNYKAQTGLTMKGDTLTEYLGSVRLVTNTNPTNPTTQYDITPKGLQNKYEIIAEGVPRKIAKGEDASLVINGNRNSTLSPINGNKQYIGKNIAIQFEKGQLIYHGKTNSYIMWVETTYSLHQSEIDDIDTKLKNYKNEVTGCEEIALDFKVKGEEENDEAKRKADEMNIALENVGPFQIFDTAKKTFIFYTGPPPECEQRIKIIDKETGKVITDQAITDIQETPNGMIITTEDGQKHNFEFSAEDGIPKLKYNDETGTLLSAQGKNGSFWYDPSTGNWNTENGYLLPMDSRYKDGMIFQTGDDGKVRSSPSQNPMNFNFGSGASGDGGFNIPLTPEKVISLTLYLLFIISGFLFVYRKEIDREK